MGKLSYDTNNSGGGWWLSDDDWRSLEAEGWTVQWVATDPDYLSWGSVSEDGRWLGALATKAYKEVPSYDAGVAEWERITGQNAEDEGCHCCGAPHYFTYDEVTITVIDNVKALEA